MDDECLSEVCDGGVQVVLLEVGGACSRVELCLDGRGFLVECGELFRLVPGEDGGVQVVLGVGEPSFVVEEFGVMGVGVECLVKEVGGAGGVVVLPGLLCAPSPPLCFPFGDLLCGLLAAGECQDQGGEGECGQVSGGGCVVLGAGLL